MLIRNSGAVLQVLRIDALQKTNEPRPVLEATTPVAGFEGLFDWLTFPEPTLLRVTNQNGRDWMKGKR